MEGNPHRFQGLPHWKSMGLFRTVFFSNMYRKHASTHAASVQVMCEFSLAPLFYLLDVIHQTVTGP